MKKESLLWQYNKKGESRMHYILGTMHVRSAEAYTPVARAKHYMEQCHTYAGEMDLNDPGLDDIAHYLKNPDALDLIDFIGEKKYGKYEKIIQKAYGINLDQISIYRPMVISNMIAESITTSKYEVALDHFLWDYGQAIGMNMTGLESAEDQFVIMKAIPLEVQLKGLKSCVSNVKTYRKKVERISSLYENGELRKLYKVTKRSMGELRKLMIYDRNARMTNKLAELSQVHATFAAVGAAHLPGAKGMLRELKKKGFQIRPVAL